MLLRKATEADLDTLCSLYESVSAYLCSQGITQWQWGAYPSRALVKDDIEAGRMYCLQAEEGIIAAVCISAEPIQSHSDLNWLFGVRPGYVHRLAVLPSLWRKGYGKCALEAAARTLAALGCDALRCGASEDNSFADSFYRALGMRAAGCTQATELQIACRAYELRLSEDCPLLPLNMHPSFRAGKLTPWGGERLKTVFDKQIPEVPTGESLEVSCIPGLESTDDCGVHLPELISRYGEKLVGPYASKPFPLLLKLIDAKEPLSVQVHPNDSYAHDHEGGKLGKTEAWLILDAAEGAELTYGIQPGTTLAELASACQHGSEVEKLLRRVKVKPGDVCYIPAGCVHAIDAGIMLYEIQQSSDITYRFYDWNRVDADGKGRELHLKQALAVTRLDCAPEPVPAPAAPIARVLDETYFTLDILNPSEGKEVDLPGICGFGLLTVLSGELKLCWQGASRVIRKGQTVLIPASAPSLSLRGTGRAALSMPR